MAYSMKKVPIQSEYKNMNYFGYIDNNGQPSGTGLLYYYKDPNVKFRQYFVENISSIKINKYQFSQNFNGMGMESIDDLQSFGFYKNSKYHGPRFFCKYKEPTLFVNFNNGVRDGFVIKLYEDDTYFISCFKKDQSIDRGIHYKSDGAIYFNKIVDDNPKCVGIRKSMWNFKVCYGLTSYMLPFEFSKSVQPLISRKIKSGRGKPDDVIYEYGIQTVGWNRTWKFNYDYQNNKILGYEHSFGQSIYKSKNMTYFGRAFESYPNSSDPLEKELGCLKTKEYTFLGSF